MNYTLTKGEEYFLGKTPVNPKIYVTKQFIPSTNKQWETFFSLLGMNENWVIVRGRILSEKITEIKDRRIISLEEPFDQIVWPLEPERKVLVEAWLEEVKKILIKKGYQNTNSFRDYFLE